MHPEEPAVAGAAQRLRDAFGDAPRVAVVLGSGLGPVADRLTDSLDVAFDALGLPSSGVQGHAGWVRVGSLEGSRVAVVRGRVHLYEGHGMGPVVRTVRALHRWGVERLLLTCSVGGITEGLNPGAMVLVTDHINLQGTNPLIGLGFGDVFPDMSTPYDPGLRAVLAAEARRLGLDLPEGVLLAMAGPAYETPAEVRMCRTLGADVVGMSTVPEVLAAVALGLPTAAIACVSNRAAGLGNEPLSHDEVIENAQTTALRLGRLLEAAIHAF